MSNRGKKATGDDEVEQLLRAAQDDVLLKLSLNSHMARAASSAAIDSDLDRRFQALKKPQKLTNHGDSVKKASKKPDAGGSKSVCEPAADDDLFARFAALKNVLPSNSSNFPRDGSVDRQATDEEEEDDEEDEVEKVINWAIDAARLDPSPISDDDDHNNDNESDYSSNNDNESDYSSNDDGDGDVIGKGKKSKKKMIRK